MTPNLDQLFTDLPKATENFVTSTGLLCVGTVIPNFDAMHIPKIFIETAQLLAYLGAGVGFFRFIGAAYTKWTRKG